MKQPDRRRFALLSCTALAALACGGQDATILSDLGGNAPELEGVAAPAPQQSRLPLGPIEARLSVEGDDLVVALENLSREGAQVSLNINVDDPLSSHANDAISQVALGPKEQARLVLPAGTIDGFDVRGNDWSRTVLRYEFELDGGRRGAQTTELALLGGSVVPREEAIAEGRTLPDLVLSSNEPLVEKADTFKACFTNQVLFAGVTSTAIDVLQNPSQNLPMNGQFVTWRSPNGSITGGGFVDANGCTAAITRQTGSWTFTMELYTFREDLKHGAFYMGDDGSLFTQNVNISVPSSGNPAAFTYQATTSFRPWQAAVFLANHTIARAAQIGALDSGNNSLRISPGTGAKSLYCPGTNAECPTARTLRLASTEINDRSTVAHETGHWIHYMNLTTIPKVDYTYNQGTLNDGCSRTKDPGSHASRSIEWQSVAHVEGLAEFFNAIAYNNLAAGADCKLLRNGGVTNCEDVGMTLKTCPTEWGTSLFFQTGNELDWTKMYWDFVADRGGKMGTYMAAERAITNWNPNGGADNAQSNVIDMVATSLKNIDSVQCTKFQQSMGGNIFDGAAQ